MDGRRSERKRDAAIVLISIALYAVTVSFGYVGLDDTVLISQSQEFLKDTGNIVQAFHQEVFRSANRSNGIFYRPLLTVSLALDTWIGGGWLGAYRITNIMLHAIVSLMVRRVLTLLAVSAPHALFFSLAFALHPSLVQAVAWLPGRNDLLLAAFVLPSMIFFIKAEGKHASRSLALHLIFFTLALLTKETALLLPLVCLTLLFHKRVKVPPRKTALLLGISWITLPLSYILLRSAFVPNAASYAMSDALRNVFLQFPGVLIYIGKSLLPLHLSVYPMLSFASLLSGSIISIVLSILLFRSKSVNWKTVTCGIIWFLVFLLPTFIIREKYSSGIVREHRLYLPILGIMLMVSEIDWVKRQMIRTKVSRGQAAGTLIALFITAFAHVLDYRDSFSFWSNAVATSPKSALAHVNLGAVYAGKNRWEEAEREYRTALSLAPDIMGAHNNLGVLFMNRNMHQKAIEEFELELQLHPEFETAKRNRDRLKQ